MSNDIPATKADLREVEREIKQLILERQIVALRWAIGIEVAYFAALWFILAHK